MSVFSRRGQKRVRQIADARINTLVGRPELKFSDNIGSGAITSTATMSAFGVAAGSTLTTRIGNEIRLRSFQGRVAIRANANATGAVFYRIIFGIDWENQGAAPTAAQVLEVPSNFLSPLNLSTTRGRFKVIWDKVIPVGPGAVVASIPAGTIQMNQADNAIKHLRLYKRLRNKQTYSGTNATDVSIGTPFMLQMSDVVVGVAPTVSTYFRTKFTDV